MTDFHFDVVVGNPPYQRDALVEGGREEPLYHIFMSKSHEIAQRSCLITPARFLFNAGQTPKSWNRQMLNDEHLKVSHFERDSSVLFPGTDIKGGIAVTYRDAERTLGPIESFSPNQTLDSIQRKVDCANNLTSIVSPEGLYKYSDDALAEYPEINEIQGAGSGRIITPKGFAALEGVVFHETIPSGKGEFVSLLGLGDGCRATRWVRRVHLQVPQSLDQWKVIVPQSTGSGQFGETLASPLVGAPGHGHTQTFLSIGPFGSELEAKACLKYIKTKFARAMLGILKITQHNKRNTWARVPLQDFTANSDVDWSRPIPEIDQQLYAKYGLTNDEIEFIESNVKAMV